MGELALRFRLRLRLSFYGSVLTLKDRGIRTVIKTAELPCLAIALFIDLRKLRPMKTRIILYVLIVVLFTSCARALTPDEAASRSFKKCRAMK